MRALAQRFPRSAAPYALAALGLGWALTAYRLGSLRHDRFATFSFDLAIHDQAIWLLARARDPFITVRGMDTFGHHFTPGYWLLAPASWLGGGPKLLLALQLGGQLLAVAAVYLLAIDLLGRQLRWLAALLATALLLHPTFGFVVWEFFHPEVMALGPLLMAYRAARNGHWRAYWVWGIAAAVFKEDMMLALAMIGLTAVASKREHRLRGLCMFAVWAVAYLAAARGLGSWRAGGPPPYETYYQPYGDSQFSVLWHFVAHPSDIAGVLFDSQRLAYYRTMLVPAGLLLPLIGWRGFLVGLPVLFGNVATGPQYPYTHDFRYHYSAIVVAAIAIGAVEGTAQVQRWVRRFARSAQWIWWALPTAILIVCVIFGYSRWSVMPGGDAYRSGFWPLSSSESTADLLDGTIDVDALGNAPAKRAAIAMVPDDAAVTAIYDVVPHLAHRSRVYDWPNPWIPVNWGLEAGKGRQDDPRTVEYVLVERERMFGGADPALPVLQERELFDHLITSEFEVVFDRDDVLLLRRRSAPSCFDASSGLQQRLGVFYRAVDPDAGVGNTCPIRERSSEGT